MIPKPHRKNASNPKRQPRLSRKAWRSTLVLLVVVSAAVVWKTGWNRTPSPPPPLPALTKQLAPPRTLSELIARSPEQLASLDIGLMNLLCAEGLRSAETLDVPNALARLDDIARYVEAETKRHYYKFRNNPAEFEHSEGYFRMLLLAVTLQEDLRVRYNPARIRPAGEFEENEVFYADSRDVFIHGLIAEDRRLGTCASMPVLYVAIGRRLGYPVKLVPTQNHLFVRWEDSRERFNVDATGRGMNRYDDEHYRQWPVPISTEVVQEFGYLKSMTPAQELTTFLSMRGMCLLGMGQVTEAIAMHEAASRFSPESRLQQLVTAQVKERCAPGRDTPVFLPPEQRDPRRFLPGTGPFPQGHAVATPGVPADPNPLRAMGTR